MNKYDNTPLSKMYSRCQVRRMFSKFDEVDMAVTTFELSKYAYLTRWKWVRDRFGSFLIIHATKGKA